MNPLFVAIQSFLQKNLGVTAVLIFSAIIGTTIVTQSYTQRQIAIKTEHAQFTERIEKNAKDITRIEAQFDTFKDEMQGKLEVINGNIIKILTLLQQEK